MIQWEIDVERKGMRVRFIAEEHQSDSRYQLEPETSLKRQRFAKQWLEMRLTRRENASPA